jgi:hypothetical protein
MQVKQGSLWSSSNGKEFVVLHVVDVNEHTWVHYRDQDCPECHEHSCYIESFLERFTPIINDRRTR